MELLSGWTDRFAQAPVPHKSDHHAYHVPKAPDYYAQRITTVTSLAEARAMVELAYQRPLSHISFDTEFRYDRPGIVIKKDIEAYDPRSIHPLLLSLAFA